ncbi:MAG: hypothetical protein ACKVOO_06350 [Burkholderiaceae bacterium]
MHAVFRFFLRLVLLLSGLVFAASLLLAVLVMLVFWAIRRLWAGITGQPLAPFVMKINPRAGFGQVFDAAVPRRTRPAPAAPEVTDVEVKTITKPD